MNVEPYLNYVRARQAATDERAGSRPKPWSDDPVIAGKFFCSVIRDDDRTSRDARNVILDLPHELRLGAALGFRLYNRTETLAALRDAGIFEMTGLGVSVAVKKVFEATDPWINTRAYKVNVEGGLKNMDTIARMVAVAAKAGRTETFSIRSRAQLTVAAVRGVVGSGPFVAYQTAQDLRWLGKNYQDEEEWALVGIGAVRGLARLRGVYGEAAHQETRDKMNEAWLKGLVARLGYSMNQTGSYDMPIGMRRDMRILLDACGKDLRLTSRDRFNMFEVEHNLCEFDKYERIRTGESAGRAFRPRE